MRYVRQVIVMMSSLGRGPGGTWFAGSEEDGEADEDGAAVTEAGLGGRAVVIVDVAGAEDASV